MEKEIIFSFVPKNPLQDVVYQAAFLIISCLQICRDILDLEVKHTISSFT